MKILFCDNSLRELVNFRGPVFDNLAEEGNQIILLSPINSDYTPSSKNIRLENIKMDRGGANPLKDLKYFFKLLSIYKRERPDFVFHYTIKPNIYGTFASRLLGIKSAVMIAGLGYTFSGKGLKCNIARNFYKFALKFADKILVLNEGNLKTLLDFKIAPADRFVLLPGGEGVDVERFK